MAENVQKTLRDSQIARWSALILVSIAMVFAYMFIDILAPLQTLFETQFRWTPDIYGKVSSSGYMLNVMGFLLIAGLILDRVGVRNSALLAGGLMLAGAGIAAYGVSDYYNNGGFGYEFFDSFWVSFPASAKMSLIGFAFFGSGLEMAGITATKAIVKWFKGKELALALAMQVSISRLGTATVFIFAPQWAATNGISTSIAIGALLLLVGFVSFLAYYVMDKKLDAQTKENEEPEEPFRIEDILKIIKSSGFWLVALLCVLYYSAVFPFQKFAVNMLECNVTLRELPADSFWASQGAVLLGFAVMISIAIASFSSNFCKGNLKVGLLSYSALALVAYCFICYQQQSASAIFSVLPLLAIGITPILGNYIDRKGKAVSMLALGSLLLLMCHLSFAFILPAVQGSATLGAIVAFITVLVLGASFSLVPASLWPTVPKLIDNNVLGTAYALIFWVQNIGLFFVPLLIGRILFNSNTGITAQVEAGTLTPEQAAVMYDYTNPLLMLAMFGVAALLLGLILKWVDKQKGYGLEEPNIK